MRLHRILFKLSLIQEMSKSTWKLCTTVIINNARSFRPTKSPSYQSGRGATTSAIKIHIPFMQVKTNS